MGLATATLLMAGAAAGAQALATAVTADWASHRLAMTLTSLGSVAAARRCTESSCWGSGACAGGAPCRPQVGTAPGFPAGKPGADP